MSGDWDEDLCKKAFMLVEELCFKSPEGRSQSEHCQEFSYIMRGGSRPQDSEISVSLLSVIVTFCGIVLLSVSLFVSWKLCWLPWRDNGGLSDGGPVAGRRRGGRVGLRRGLLPAPPSAAEEGHALVLLTLPVPVATAPAPPALLRPGGGGERRGAGGGGGGGGPQETQEHSYLDMDSYPNNAGSLKLNTTSPELPPTSEGAQPPKELPNAHSQQQVTTRPKPMTHQLSSPDFHGEDKSDQVTSIGQIKPELYRLRQGDQGDGKPGDTCGKISFLLRYAFNTEQLVVKILKALDLPAKDANGFSDPYVKIYLLPDRKKKFQTKVHRKTLNPVFNETFQFGVPLAELHARKLHFSVYDFDRFSRHDLIGQVVVDNLLDFSEGSGDKPIWRDIVEGAAEKADLGELNFSLCYLPTAGRLTATIIKATNLKAMDLTGFSDPYVKASLICDGRRLKKRKTSIKKNTLNPTYNEALVFDIPNENIENVNVIIAVMDYDCIGHNEVIGMCRVGSDAEGPGREHWTAMLANPRKPIDQWYQLVEEKAMTTFVSKSATASPKPHIVVDSPHSE
ncbi:LOW QUALITY PROTEIN: synaptotagmin-C [Clupea harengus]|uniref:LOW QUALITY PROTEIN: synaptotagmin-C n=1 Tax=Clupea harengus TaxID=7950 RepID=A0A8M1KPQ7_CLUHA|nr:LOW QUALITY PROTEIN: synaptotagmin-C [Clupea harengus]